MPSKKEVCSGCDGMGWLIVASNGNTDRDWIERCDACEMYHSDTSAAFAAMEHTGRKVLYAKNPDSETPNFHRPFLEPTSRLRKVQIVEVQNLIESEISKNLGIEVHVDNSEIRAIVNYKNKRIATAKSMV